MPLSHNVVSWPTHPPIQINKFKTVERDLYDAHEIYMTSQDYTHFDAPSHMIKGGKTIDAYEIYRFVAPAIILNFSNKEDLEITDKDLQQFSDQIKNVNAVILFTDFNKDPKEFKYNWKYLGVSSAKYLSQFSNIKMVAIDAPSIAGWSGDVPAAPHIITVKDAIDIHLYLLEKDILIVEGLYDVKKAIGNNKYVYGVLIALPLQIVGLDGGPCRVIFTKFT
ncbi:cyclase [Acidianus manzaensis]|uniref:Cyclase n=2 Tax=Acidianus manzaensis TaxID=282676 RepID=A0A1W6K3H9_9CREN|nr:cyclase [Acidianus manzaensis]